MALSEGLSFLPGFGMFALTEQGMKRIILCLRTLAGLCVVAALACGCSVRRIAARQIADALAASGGTFASDEDPELVREAIPFGLKTMESL